MVRYKNSLANLRTKIRSLNHKIGGSQGYTLLEIILVVVLTGMLSALFAEILVSSIQIYTQQNLRKSSHIDARRSFDMLVHDIREWDAWNGGQTSSRLDFNKSNMFHYSGLLIQRDYYLPLRVAYQISSSNLIYQRNDDGSFNNQYSLLTNSAVGQSTYQIITQGGKERVRVNVVLNVQGQPMRLRTYVFPRKQGQS